MEEERSNLLRRIEEWTARVYEIQTSHSNLIPNLTHHPSYDFGYCKGKLSEMEYRLDILEETADIVEECKDHIFNKLHKDK